MSTTDNKCPRCGAVGEFHVCPPSPFTVGAITPASGPPTNAAPVLLSPFAAMCNDHVGASQTACAGCSADLRAEGERLTRELDCGVSDAERAAAEVSICRGDTRERSQGGEWETCAACDAFAYQRAIARVEKERDAARAEAAAGVHRINALLDRRPCGHLVADAVDLDARPRADAMDAAVYDVPLTPCGGCVRAAQAERDISTWRDAMEGGARAKIDVFLDRIHKADAQAAAEAARAKRLHEAAFNYIEWAETMCRVPHVIDASSRLRAALALPATDALQHDAEIVAGERRRRAEAEREAVEMERRFRVEQEASREALDSAIQKADRLCAEAGGKGPTK